MLKITKAELMALNPCRPETRIALFKARKHCTVEQALAAGVSIRDILWVAGKLGRKDLCVAFALACAVHAEKFDNAGVAKLCNAATADYIADPSPVTLAGLKQKHAAADAYAYAYAANAYAYAADADAREKETTWQKKKLIEIFGGTK